MLEKEIQSDDIYYVDVVVIGGGIAGLFTLAKLINAGYKAVLLEKNALGSGQTIKSQGIIHGGTKYTLLGKQTKAQKQITAMPAYWNSCLKGTGDVDLSACEVLTKNQCMWAMPNLSSKITGFFASRLMTSQVNALKPINKPVALAHPDCQGNFYALDEPVLNVQSLLHAFAHQYGQYLLTDCDVSINESDYVIAKTTEKTFTFQPNKIIITAGEGNQEYTEKQQIRPLRMVYARVPLSYGKLFVHVLEASDKPRLTVSSYADTDNTLVWYLGGNVAEKGTDLSHEETITLAKKELTAIFPWLDFTHIEFGSFIVNRAEGSSGGKRPDTPLIIEEDNHLIAYPTKLALAPLLADGLLRKLPPPINTKNTAPENSLPAFPKPRIALFPWQAIP